MDFYNDRKRHPVVDGDDAREVNKQTVTEANDHIFAATPVYKHPEVDRKIKTTAVARFRERAAGRRDFASIKEYKNFIHGTQG